jgi:putative ATP-dependent endonuclease of OLD family
VLFRESLTVLIGENNAGKSNVIDGIRLMTAPADGRRSRYCEVADITSGSDADGFTIRATYAGLTHAEQALMIAASSGIGTDEISHQLRFDEPVDAQRRGRTSWTVGSNDSVDPEPAARDRIRHVYLPPLRDAEATLSTGSGERIEFVLRVLAEADEIEELEAEASNAFHELGNHSLLRRMDESVSAELQTVTAGSIPHQSRLTFADPVLRQLARALRLKLGEHGVDPTDLASSGLGYANLLFLATVVVELAATRDADLTLFLVEEPEAHLHPQLQIAVLDFLWGALDRSEVPGAVQVVISTHSPQLSSAVSVEHVEVLKRTRGEERERPPVTKAVPVWELGLEPADVRKVDRYLDSTRSAMLFGPRVILVEGIAEALLLPSLARRLLGPGDFRRYRGSTLVAIDGVDFEPYLRILLTPHDGVCIANQVVAITDEDPGAPGDRKTALTELASGLDADNRLHLAIAPVTLEAALMEAGNVEALKAAFMKQRPRSSAAWSNYIEDHATDHQPEQMVALLRDKRVLKGDFAQSVAAWVDDASSIFETPSYLLEATEAASSSDDA